MRRALVSHIPPSPRRAFAAGAFTPPICVLHNLETPRAASAHLFLSRQAVRFSQKSTFSTTSMAQDRNFGKVKTASGAATSDLVKLGDDVFLVQATEAQSRPQDANVVVIFGWMDAPIRHIRKYSERYRTMMPSATLVLVASHSNFFWSSHAKRKAAIQPAIDFLDQQGITNSLQQGVAQRVDTNETARPPSLLLHAFSNGGAIQMTTMGNVLRDRSPQSHPETSTSRDMSRPIETKHTFPAKAIILDSTPGSNALRPLLKAFTMPFKSQLVKLPLYVLLTTTWAILGLYTKIFRPKPQAIDKLRLDLYDPSVLPSDAERLYVYSKSDDIILAPDVEAHIEQARSKGIKVSTEKYDKSPHVSHARIDGTRYWDAVKALWDRTL